jgi:DNA helicase HerA-like ATPase
MDPLLTPVSLGEIVDKMTILEIKVEQLSGPAQAHASHELSLLRQVLSSADIAMDPALEQQLKRVNRGLWTIEDDIREHERRKEFGPSFIELARSVYFTNDERAAIKRQINEHYGSTIVEVKSYSDYT